MSPVILFYTLMKYEITITPSTKENDELNLSLDTNKGLFLIKSYGATMNYEEFTEFADAIQELRQKFVIINNTKNADNNGRTN